ncbi:hypothetical protein IscW_ISCW007548, partial [Ixodes scapularis]
MSVLGGGWCNLGIKWNKHNDAADEDDIVTAPSNQPVSNQVRSSQEYKNIYFSLFLLLL